MKATQYWHIQHPLATCQTASTAIPWLLSIIALTVAWAFLLGANDVRRWIRKFLNFSPQNGPRSPRKAVSLTGSLVLYAGMTLATAQLLRAPISNNPDGTKVELRTAIGAWLVRPMPGLMVSVTSVTSLSTYHANAMEIQYVETVLALGAGYFYVSIFKESQKAISSLSAYQTSSSSFSAPSATTAISKATTTTSIVPAVTFVPGGLMASPDRTCGGENRYTCLGSAFGDCCSSFGFCGSDADYCTWQQCQPEFGTCSPAKKARKRRRDSALPDGTCGVESGASCWESKWGNCCSAFSFCGSNETYCGEGCQPGYGDCLDTATPAPNVLDESEQRVLKLLKDLRWSAIFGIIVFSASFVILVLPILTRRGKVVAACFVGLSLGRFIVGTMLWISALRLDADAFCVSDKAMMDVTIMWVMVPLIDHSWRAVFGI